MTRKVRIGLLVIVLTLAIYVWLQDRAQVNAFTSATQAAADSMALMLTRDPPQERDKHAKMYFSALHSRPQELKNLVIAQTREKLPSGKLRQSVLASGNFGTDLRNLLGLPPAEINVASSYEFEGEK